MIMRMTRYALFALMMPYAGFAQGFINGSFEQNKARCAFNVPNDSFNVLVAGAYAFGAASQLDIIKDSCGFSLAQDGRFFLGLGVDTAGKRDALALNISTPLIAGRTYQLTWYDKKAQSYVATGYGFFGSMDSSNNGPYGLSISAAPTDTVWRLRTQTFKALAPYKFITVEATGSAYAWVHLDNLSLSEIPTGISAHAQVAEQLHLYPNPAKHLVRLSLEKADGRSGSVSVIDVTGRTVIETMVLFDKMTELDIAAIPSGSYVVHAVCGEWSFYEHLIVCK